MSKADDPKGAVVAAAGFRAVGLACGLKPKGHDLALLVADERVPAAAVFTTSRAAAPPVQVSRQHLSRSPHARAVLVTSGAANAGTGQTGVLDSRQTVEAVAQRLDCAVEDILVCSTGVIGARLPVDKIIGALPHALESLGDSDEAGHEAAKAIMTTDTHPKEALRRGAGFVVGGMAKGAAMVRPDMATMLAFVTTDARLSPDALDGHLRAAVDETFNAINIDGCQSTNDTVMALASGASQVEPDAKAFRAALTEVCGKLARQIVADAECATRVITLRISGASDAAAAREVGKFVADSDLVRCSFHGGDPNWGRILQALGVCSVPVEPQTVVIRYAGVQTFRHGDPMPYDEAALLDELQDGDFTVDIELGDGPGRAEVLTCDLTPEYVRFNAERS